MIPIPTAPNTQTLDVFQPGVPHHPGATPAARKYAATSSARIRIAFRMEACIVARRRRVTHP
jgi:hypothetical protein